jgi:hypothetical protein
MITWNDPAILADKHEFVNEDDDLGPRWYSENCLLCIMSNDGSFAFYIAHIDFTDQEWLGGDLPAIKIGDPSIIAWSYINEPKF